MCAFALMVDAAFEAEPFEQLLEAALRHRRHYRAKLCLQVAEGDQRELLH